VISRAGRRLFEPQSDTALIDGMRDILVGEDVPECAGGLIVCAFIKGGDGGIVVSQSLEMLL